MLPENAEAAGIGMFRWPGGEGCQVSLRGNQEDLASLVPIVADILTGAAGEHVLYIKMPRLRSLAGIEGLPRLDGLEIHHTPLVDLNALAQGGRAVPTVATLSWFTLTHTPVVDLLPLESITTLESLDLSRNHDLRDVRPLRHMSRVRWLSLHDTAVIDLSPLAGLTALKHLGVSTWNDDGDASWSLRPLAGLRRLTSLQVYDRECTDLEGLRPLSALTELMIRVGDDLGPIPALPNLKDLWLASASLDSIEALSRAPRLESLNLNLDRPVGLAPLAKIPTLVRVNVLAWEAREHVDAEMEALYRLRPDLRPKIELGEAPRPELPHAP